MQLKSFLRYPIDIHRARRLLADRTERRPELHQRPIVLDLRTPQLLFDCGRHLASLSHYAQQAGSSFYVRSSSMMLAAMSRKIHGGEMLSDAGSHWLSTSETLPEDALVLCDYVPKPDSNDTRQYVQMLIGADIDRSLPVMPYPMHPATLRTTDESDLQTLRANDRRCDIFFAGNQKSRYGDEKMQRNFAVQSRLELLATLRQRFPDEIVETATGVSKQQPIALVDSRLHPTPACDWLPTLSRAEFFLCCPGSSQPTCHNLIEAMCVGTIPLIEYGDRVTPALRDGETAICFKGRGELIDSVSRILAMPPQEKRRLRENVIMFFEEHLRGERFLARLRDGQIGSQPKQICMPFHETNFYTRAETMVA